MNAQANNPPHADQARCEEALSCLLDGELDPATCAALLERLRADETACREWMLLAAAGDAVRSQEVAAWHSTSFVARLASALDREAPICAPRSRRTRVLRRVVLPGAAIAAAAVVLGVVAVPQLRGSAPATQIASPMPGQSAVVPVVTEGAALDPATLEAYLLAHREAAGGALMPRSAAYLRTANPTAPAPR
jgi:negative regulator of sigma E activity